MKHVNFKLIALSIISLILWNCSDNDSTETTTTTTDYSDILTNEAANVITLTYKSLNDEAGTLQTAVNNFTIGDETTFEQIKDAWRATRIPWEQSEGFLFGPVGETQLNIDGKIDSWPVDVTAINALLNSGNSITTAVLETNNNTRGFHTIEYFVWGLDGAKTAADLTARDVEYLKAATTDLKTNTQALYDAWQSNGGNYQSNFINAGLSGSVYTSQKVAIEEIVDGMVTIADEVANGKIETPLNGNSGSAAPEEEESRFSHNSKADFSNNIRSIQNAYLGDYDGFSGKGITDIVAELNGSLDITLKAQIEEAIDAIETIPGTFTDAIVNNRAAVQNAQTKVRALQSTLESQLVPLISNL